MRKVLLTDREAKIRKVLMEKLKEKVILPISASALLRSRKRKEKEPFHVYRRAMANMKRALRSRVKGGPTASVFIDKTNYRVLGAEDTKRVSQILEGVAINA
jgi:hypothetical protein